MAQSFSLAAIGKSTPIDIKDCNRVGVVLVTPDSGTGLTASIEVSNLVAPNVATATDWATFTGGSGLTVSATGAAYSLPPARWARINLTARSTGSCRADFFLQKDQSTEEASGR